MKNSNVKSCSTCANKAELGLGCNSNSVLCLGPNIFNPEYRLWRDEESGPERVLPLKSLKNLSEVIRDLHEEKTEQLESEIMDVVINGGKPLVVQVPGLPGSMQPEKVVVDQSATDFNPLYPLGKPAIEWREEDPPALDEAGPVPEEVFNKVCDNLLMTGTGAVKTEHVPTEDIFEDKPTDDTDPDYDPNHPSYYAEADIPSGIECWDHYELAMTEAEFVGHMKGLLYKYLFRAGRKGDKSKKVQDLRKCIVYLERWIKFEEGNRIVWMKGKKSDK